MVKPLSPETKLLIKELHADPGVFSRLVRAHEERELELLIQIGDSRDPSAIPALVPFLFSGNSHAAAEAINTLVSCVNTDKLVDLDQMVRSRSEWDSPQRLRFLWRNIKPSSLPGSSLETGFLNVLGVMTFHPSGFVRESSLVLIEKHGIAALPFLLVRMNDWVSAIRKKAIAAVKPMLIPANAAEVIKCLGLISRVASGARDNHKWLIQAVTNLLQLPECKKTLLEGLKVPDTTIRRTCFELLRANSDIHEMIALGLKDKDQVLQLKAARLVSQLPSVDALRLATSLLRHRNAAVRQTGLLFMHELTPESTRPLLEEMVFDSHALLRATARYLLDPSFNRSFASDYRAKLQSNDSTLLVNAIHGLREVGNADDAKLLQAFINDPNSKVKKAAIQAIGKLNPLDYVDQLLDIFAQQVPGSSSYAWHSLKDCGHVLPGSLLWEMFTSGDAPFQLRILSLIVALPKWVKLGYIIRATANPNPEVATLAQYQLQRWLANSRNRYEAPTSSQIKDIQLALAEVDGSLDRKTVQKIHFFLR